MPGEGDVYDGVGLERVEGVHVDRVSRGKISVFVLALLLIGWALGYTWSFDLTCDMTVPGGNNIFSFRSKDMRANSDRCEMPPILEKGRTWEQCMPYDMCNMSFVRFPIYEKLAGVMGVYGRKRLTISRACQVTHIWGSGCSQAVCDQLLEFNRNRTFKYDGFAYNMRNSTFVKGQTWCVAESDSRVYIKWWFFFFYTIFITVVYLFPSRRFESAPWHATRNRETLCNYIMFGSVSFILIFFPDSPWCEIFFAHSTDIRYPHRFTASVA